MRKELTISLWIDKISLILRAVSALWIGIWAKAECIKEGNEIRRLTDIDMMMFVSLQSRFMCSPSMIKGGISMP